MNGSAADAISGRVRLLEYTESICPLRMIARFAKWRKSPFGMTRKWSMCSGPKSAKQQQQQQTWRKKTNEWWMSRNQVCNAEHTQSTPSNVVIIVSYRSIWQCSAQNEISSQIPHTFRPTNQFEVVIKYQFPTNILFLYLGYFWNSVLFQFLLSFPPIFSVSSTILCVNVNWRSGGENMHKPWIYLNYCFRSSV